MADDFFGPASDNAVTTRPSLSPATARPGGAKTWFKPCSAEDSDDGTMIAAEWLNLVIGNFEALRLGAGVTSADVTPGADGMMLACVIKLMGPYLAKAGGTMTGPLALAANAATAMQAVPLQQLQAFVPDALSTASGAAPSYSVRAWVSIGDAPSIKAAGNVISIADLGAGQISVTFAEAMSDANYAVVGHGFAHPTSDYDAVPQITSRTVSGFTAIFNDPTENTLRDPAQSDFIVIR